MHYKKNDLKFQIPYYLLSVRNKKLLWMYRSNSPHTEQSEQRLLAQNDSKMKKYGHKLPEYQKYTIIFHNLLITYDTRLAWPFTIYSLYYCTIWGTFIQTLSNHFHPSKTQKNKVFNNHPNDASLMLCESHVKMVLWYEKTYRLFNPIKVWFATWEDFLLSPF